MAWVKIDDQFPDHLKLAELGDYAPLCGWLYVCGLAFCNRQLTDGRIPKAHVSRLATFRHVGMETGGIPGTATFGHDINSDTLAAHLVSVGLWEDHGSHYAVHDYLDYQPSREDIERERRQAEDRQQRWRERRYKRRKSVTNGVTSGVTNGVTYAVTTPTPDPDPVEKEISRSSAKQHFGVWWSDYPRKVGKAAAWRLWEKLNPDTETVASMLAVLARQKASPEWQRDGGKFIPHPSTYLHQGRHEDEFDGTTMPPPYTDESSGHPLWAWCDACQDAHPAGKCRKQTA